MQAVPGAREGAWNRLLGVTCFFLLNFFECAGAHLTAIEPCWLASNVDFSFTKAVKHRFDSSLPTRGR